MNFINNKRILKKIEISMNKLIIKLYYKGKSFCEIVKMIEKNYR